MKCLFIINPSAGTKTIQKKLDQIIGQMILKKLVSTIDVFYTEKKDDAYQYCLKLKDDDYDFVVSVGGDGTVNEIINGFIENHFCLLYTSPSPRDRQKSRMPSSA